MHPEIKKFWEEFPLGHMTFGDGEIYYILSDMDYYNQDGPPPPQLKDIIYFKTSMRKQKPYRYRIDGEWYSEQEMLKLIKLKLFL